MKNMQNRREAVYVCSMLLFLLLFGNAEAVTVTVNPGVRYQEFEGWGTSICWWGNIIGKYPDQARDSIMDLLFDTSNGLGLSIIRYNIGGGDNPSHNHMGVGKMMDGFKAGENAQYDWTKDAGQRWVVNAAKQRIPSDWFIAEAFSNSPPYWMTVSGCASGGSGGSNNLKSGYYSQFVDYLTTVVKHFNDEWGIFFRTLEPMNEPDNGWTVNGAQEGCSFSHENQAKLILEVKKQLDEKQLLTKISAPDGASYGSTIAAYNSYNANVKSCIYQINTHGYFGGSRTDLLALAQRDGKKLWASEIDGSGAEYPFDQWTHNHNDIVPGLDIANRIIRDLRDLKAEAWITWQVVESEQAQTSVNKNWGCIHADFTGGNRYYITKKYHAIRQFTSIIRPFSRMIRIDNNDAVAFLSPEQDRLVIVQRNAGNSAVTFDYNLSNFQQVGPKVSVWRTSATENFQKLDDLTVVNGTLSTSSSPKSITTYVIPIQRGAAGNLVTNGDFSSGSAGWTFNAWSGSGTGSVVNGEYNISIGSPASRSHDIQLVQNSLYLEKGMSYRVSFDAYSSVNRTLEVNVQMGSDPWTSYLPQLQQFNLSTEKQKFSFVFKMESQTTDRGQISFNAGLSAGTVFLDNVSMEEIDPTGIQSVSNTVMRSPVNVRMNNSTLEIEFRESEKDMSLKLFDIKGTLVKTFTIKAGNGRYYADSYDLSNMPTGYYMAKISSGKRILHTSKIMLVR